MFSNNSSLNDAYDLYDSCNLTDPNCTDVDPFAMPTWEKVLFATSFFFMVAAADIGNIIVIWIVLSDKRMRSVTNYFIVNLSTADIINATFNVIPNFTYMLTGNWPFGWFYCKLGTSFSIISVTCSVFTLVAISVDRYNAIINPLRPRLSRLKTIIIATSIWAIGIAISVPALLYQTTVVDDLDRVQCISHWPDAAGYKSFLEYCYNVTFMFVTYFLPMISMLYTYSRICIELWGSRAIGEATNIQMESIKSKRKVVKMMVFVVIIFCVCWLPYQAYFIISHLYPSINHSTIIQDVYLSIYWLAMSNSMYNPMIYCYMNQRFRKGFGVVLYFFNPLRCLYTKRENTNQVKANKKLHGTKMCHLSTNGLRVQRASNANSGMSTFPTSIQPSPINTNRSSSPPSPDSGSCSSPSHKSVDKFTTTGMCGSGPNQSQLTVDSILSRASRLAVDKICISVCDSPEHEVDNPEVSFSETKPNSGLPKPNSADANLCHLHGNQHKVIPDTQKYKKISAYKLNQSLKKTVQQPSVLRSQSEGEGYSYRGPGDEREDCSNTGPEDEREGYFYRGPGEVYRRRGEEKGGASYRGPGDGKEEHSNIDQEDKGGGDTHQELGQRSETFSNLEARKKEEEKDYMEHWTESYPDNSRKEPSEEVEEGDLVGPSKEVDQLIPHSKTNQNRVIYEENVVEESSRGLGGGEKLL